MKSYFLKLFAYDLFANRIIFDAIEKASNPAKALQLMNHLLVAMQIWLNRCKGLPPVAGTLWTNEIVVIDPQCIEDSYKNWMEYINTIEEKDFCNIH